MNEILAQLVGQLAFLEEDVHQLPGLGLEQVEVAAGGRVLQVGQQRLGPVLEEIIQLRVDSFELGYCRWP